MIVFFRNEERTFFVYAFAKAKRANIKDKDLRDFKKRAKIALSLTNEEIRNKKIKRDLIEVL